VSTAEILEVWNGLRPLEQAFFVGIGAGIAFLSLALALSGRGRKSGRREEQDTVKFTREESERLREDVELATCYAPIPPPENRLCEVCGDSADAEDTFCQRCGSRFDVTQMRQQLSWDRGDLVLTVGRDPDSDIRLFEGKASGKHARLIFRKGSLLLEDAGSTNRTRIGTNADPIPVNRPILLAPGDLVRFADDYRTYDALVSVLAEAIQKRSRQH
jgi:hypothetical protein